MPRSKENNPPSPIVPTVSPGHTLDALYRISSLVGKTDDTHEALGLILDEVMAQTGASSASVSLINANSGLLEIEAYRGERLEGTRMDLELGQGITGWVAQNAQPLSVDDVHADDRYIVLDEAIASEAAVPMEADGKVIGVLNIDSQQKNAFSSDVIKLLTVLSAEAVRVLGRLWAVRELRQKNIQLEGLIKTSQNLVAEIELKQILKSLVRETREMIACRTCALYVVDDIAQENTHAQGLTLSALSGGRGYAPQVQRIHLQASALGAILAGGPQMAVNAFASAGTGAHENENAEPQHFALTSAEETPLKNALLTPVQLGERTIGVLAVYADAPRSFSQTECQVLATLARLGAAALDNARLYERVFESEAQLRKNERLTTLGLIAAEIAHEIRNPLTVLKLLFESLGIDFKPEDPRTQDIHVIREKLGHLEDIVNRVLQFGKTAEVLHARYPLGKLALETLQLMRIKLRHSNITVVTTGLEATHAVQVHKGQIQQVLLNLLLNAEQAMHRGGQIALELDPPAENGMLTLRVRDTGEGIPTELQARIFEGFLSGKAAGTGLGLSIAHSLVHSHGGQLRLVESSPETGTTFEILLPAA